MTQTELAASLGISVRTLQRRNKQAATATEPEVKAPETAPTPAQPAPGQPEEPEPPAPTPVDDLETWSTEALKAGIVEWMRPSDPNAPPSNAPAEHSCTMPSPENFARLTRANAILLKRSFGGFTPAHAPRSTQAFSVGMLGTGVSSYTPATGYGLSEQDVAAESLTLKNHPEFARNRYSR